jgi:alcohol dehydrogenase (cytochrome c)
MAFDARTGKELWHFNTIPIGIEPGAETWHAGGAPPAGGGFWTSFSLDPATHELFAPVSNPYPDWDAGERLARISTRIPSFHWTRLQAS